MNTSLVFTLVSFHLRSSRTFVVDLGADTANPAVLDGAVTTVDTNKGPTGTIVNQRPSERTEVETGTNVAVEVEG